MVEVVLVVVALVVGVVWRTLRWITRVKLATKAWVQFSETTFPAFTREIRDDRQRILLRPPPR